MAKTRKDAIGGGYTTDGKNGTTYKTNKDLIGGGYTTHGSDGSTYKTTRNLFGKGYTTIKTSGRAGGIGGGFALFFIIAIIMSFCISILNPMSYVLLAVVMIVPFLSEICESYNISRIWCSGPVFCFAASRLIDSIISDVETVAGTNRAGGGAVVLLLLLAYLLLALMFAVYGLGESGTGFFAAAVLIIAMAFCALNGLFAATTGPIHSFQKIVYCAIGLLTLIALLDQIHLSRKH